MSLVTNPEIPAPPLGVNPAFNHELPCYKDARRSLLLHPYANLKHKAWRLWLSQQMLSHNHENLSIIPAPMERASHDGALLTPELGSQRQEHPWSSWASQSSWIREFCVLVIDPVSEHKMDGSRAKRLKDDLRPTHIYIHEYPPHTQTHSYPPHRRVQKWKK